MNELLNKMDMSSWGAWKHSLGVAVEFAEELGVSLDTITNYATQFGSYLAHNVPTGFSESKVLKELWEVASPEEQKAIACCMVKLSKKSN